MILASNHVWYQQRTADTSSQWMVGSVLVRGFFHEFYGISAMKHFDGFPFEQIKIAFSFVNVFVFFALTVAIIFVRFERFKHYFFSLEIVQIYLMRNASQNRFNAYVEKCFTFLWLRFLNEVDFSNANSFLWNCAMCKFLPPPPQVFFSISKRWCILCRR